MAISPVAMRAAVEKSAADGFNPNVLGTYNSIGPVVYAVAVQPDGKILIGGAFSEVAPQGGTSYTHNNIARINPDGSNDASFSADIDGQINAILLQSDGYILIGGKFNTVNGTACKNAARLKPDGTLDTSFMPNTGGSVTGVAVVDTSEVVALALQADGKILIAGGFSTVNNGGTAETRKGLARFNADGSFDETLADVAVDGQINAVAVQADGALLIGGVFTHAGGKTDFQNRVARVSSTGVLDQTFNPDLDGAVNAIVIQTDGMIIIGGAFTKLLNSTEEPDSARSRLARLYASGEADTTYAPIPDGTVTALKIQADGRLLLVGEFSSSSGGVGAYIGRLLPDGEVDTSFYPTPNQTVYAVDVQSDGSVVLGGMFSTLAGTGKTSVSRSRVARVNSHGGLDTDFRPDVNGRFQTMALDASGRLLVAGSFTSVAGATHDGLVRINTDGTVDSTLTTQVSGGIISHILPQSDGKIMIMGQFTSVNNIGRRYVARLEADGTVDESFSAQPDSYVSSIVQQDDKYIIGGSFSTLSPGDTTEPITRYSIARLKNDGSVDLTFDTKVYSSISVMLKQTDGKIFIAGSFTSIVPNGSTTSYTRYRLARLNADGSLDTDYAAGIDGTVYDALLESDGKIVIVGAFSAIAGTGATESTAVGNIARLKPGGAVDTAFNPVANDVIRTILPITDGYLLGGYFTAIHHANSGAWVNRHFAARMSTDGVVDDSVFDLGIEQLSGNTVATFLKDSSGRILVGGSFSSLKFNTSSHHSLARFTLSSSGAATIDETFAPEMSGGMGAAVRVVTQQSDGSVILGGSFSSISGTTSTNIALFNVDGVPNASFYPNIGGEVQTISQLPAKGQTISSQRSGFAWLENDGQLRSGIVKGSDPSSFSTVRAITVQPDGKILVSASVIRPATEDYPGGTPDYLVRFNADGSFDADFEPQVNSTVLVMKVQSDGKILIGGSFTTVGTSSDNSRYYMARLNSDGSVDTAFDPNFGGGVVAIELQSDGKILVGGTYTTVAGTDSSTSKTRYYIARLNTDGTVDTTFNPHADSTVRAIKVLSSGKILIGGLFTTLQPGATGTEYTRNYLALLNSDGTVDTTDFELNGYVSQITVQDDGKILLGGAFTRVLGETRNYLARLNADLTLDTSFNPNPTDQIYSIAMQTDGKILIAGDFTALQPGSTSYDSTKATPRRYTARLFADGTLDSTFNPNFNDGVNCVTTYTDGSILVGGTFSSFQPTGSVLVGGSFETISGVAVKNLALFSTDGSVSSTFIPNPDGTVNATQILADGSFVVAGSFTTIGGESRGHVARFTSANVLDTTFNPNADDEVRALALQADGKILLGGKFKNVGGSGHAYLARVDATGAIDNSFTASITGEVSAIIVQGDQKILVLSAGSGVQNIITRLNADGSVDATFTSTNGGANAINAIALQTDGRIVVGGAFTTIAGQAKSYLARLNADGTYDSTLTAVPNGPVLSLMISPDGKILLGGRFNTVDGLARYGVARLAPITVPASSFSVNLERSTLTWTRSGAGPEISAVLFQGSKDGYTWTDLPGTASRIAGTSNWAITGLTLPADMRYFVRAFGNVIGSSQGSSGVVEARGQTYLSAVPVITSATAVSSTVGQSFTYAVSSTGSPTGYSATGLPAGLSFDSINGIISGTPTTAGTYTVAITAINGAGSTTFTLTIYVAASSGTPDTTSRLVNIAELSHISTTNILISGFVVNGTGTMTVLIRGVGPGLTDFGVSSADVLASPHVKIYRAGSSDPLQEADAWGGATAVAEAAARVGAQPLNASSKDVAFLVTLNPGAYTVHITDNNTTGGYALAEIYDASVAPAADSARLVNISARGVVNGTLVIGGFVISGNSPKKVLIRGIGPGLADFLSSGVLLDSKLELVRNVNGVNTVVASNDNWGTPTTVDTSYPAATGAEIKAVASKVGAFALKDGSADAAVLVTLPPGAYSANVSGVGLAEGAAMVEVYEVAE